MAEAKKMVTFQTILDMSRETPKAVKVWTGNHFPKSLVTYVVKREETRTIQWRGREIVTPCQIVDITMPAWLANR